MLYIKLFEHYRKWINVPNIRRDYEMIVPDFTRQVIGGCVYQAGTDAVLADVDLETNNIIPSVIKETITARTTASRG